MKIVLKREHEHRAITQTLKAAVCTRCGSDNFVHVPANRDDSEGYECFDCGKGWYFAYEVIGHQSLTSYSKS